MKESNFDFVAPFYDTLAKIVFKDRLINAKSSLLTLIKPNATVLILGGGTGQLLEQLDNLNTPFQIVFLESSENMLQLAKRRSFGKQLKVDFMHQSVFDLTSKTPFDVVITNFFLDVFTKEDLLQVIDLIYSSLKKEGSWIVTDFQKESINIKHRLLLTMMHLFFRIFSRLQAKDITDFGSLLQSKGLILKQEKLFMKTFVFSRQYIK